MHERVHNNVTVAFSSRREPLLRLSRAAPAYPTDKLSPAHHPSMAPKSIAILGAGIFAKEGEFAFNPHSLSKTRSTSGDSPFYLSSLCITHSLHISCSSCRLTRSDRDHARANTRARVRSRHQPTSRPSQPSARPLPSRQSTPAPAKVRPPSPRLLSKRSASRTSSTSTTKRTPGSPLTPF